MCQMLSYVVDKTGKLYWITPDQRREIWNGIRTKNPDFKQWVNNRVATVDSHATICYYHKIKEDQMTKLEVDPFKREVRIDTENEDVPERYTDASFKEFANILDKMTWEDIEVCHLGYRGYALHDDLKKLYNENKGKRLVLVSQLSPIYYKPADSSEIPKMLERTIGVKIPNKKDVFLMWKNADKTNYKDYYRFKEIIRSGTDPAYVLYANEDGYKKSLHLEAFVAQEDIIKYDGVVPKKPKPVKVPKPKKINIKGYSVGVLVKWKGTKSYNGESLSSVGKFMNTGDIRKVAEVYSDRIKVFVAVTKTGKYEHSYHFTTADWELLDKPKRKKKDVVLPTTSSGLQAA